MSDPHHLTNLSWTEARDHLSNPRAVGLLPIGAIEAHGPHLPLDTDVCLSIEWCERISAALDGGDVPENAVGPRRTCLILPPSLLSVTKCAGGFAGTLGLQPGTERALLSDLLDSLGRHSLSAVALVNSHLEPEHVAILESLASESASSTKKPRVLFVNHCRKPWALELGEEFRGGDCHAGAYETALMLASRFRDRVRTQIARGLPAAYHGLITQLRSGVTRFEQMGAAQAYFGNPAAATAEEGERLWSVLVRMWLEPLRAIAG